MTQYDERTEWYEFNQETIDALLTDGSEADATYTIEHHMACKDFERLEKAAVDAFKAGFEVTDAEEVYLELHVSPLFKSRASIPSIKRLLPSW